MARRTFFANFPITREDLENYCKRRILAWWVLKDTFVDLYLNDLYSNQACSQKFAMGGLFRGSGGFAPSRRMLGVWGLCPQRRRLGFGGFAPSRRRHGGFGAEPPALENFAFFCKNNLILELQYFDKKIMLLKRGLEIGRANMIKLVA